MKLFTQACDAIRQLVVAVVAFEVVVIGGVATFMAAGMLLGYLPYSDRPGPGWYGPGATVRSLPIVWQWVSLNWWAPPAYGASVFVIAKAVSLIPRLPGVVVRVVAAVLAAGAAVLWVAATGWVFALALSVQWTALFAGIAYGTCVIPRILDGKLAKAA